MHNLEQQPGEGITGNVEADEYYWQMVSRNIGVYTREEQALLRTRRIAIFGLGGVGGLEAILAARMGIGHITGVDPDTFETSNINRQMLASSSVVGRSKAAVTRAAVTDINPYLSTRFEQVAVDEHNVAELVAGHDLVLEAMDDMPSRVIVHRTARELGVPSVGMSGSPPNRGFVCSFLPGGVAYEEVLNLPGMGKKLTDPGLRQQIADIKKARAQHSVGLGAPQDWADDFAAGKASWIITPVRAHLISLFSFHEVVQILTGRDPLAAAPKAVLIDLDSPHAVRIETAPDGGWDYATL